MVTAFTICTSTTDHGRQTETTKKVIKINGRISRNFKPNPGKICKRHTSNGYDQYSTAIHSDQSNQLDYSSPAIESDQTIDNLDYSQNLSSASDTATGNLSNIVERMIGQIENFKIRLLKLEELNSWNLKRSAAQTDVILKTDTSIENLKTELSSMKDEFGFNLDTEIKRLENQLTTIKLDFSGINTTVTELQENQNDNTSTVNETLDLREAVTEIQCESRKNNLLIFGIEEVPQEQAELVIKSFLQQNLEVKDPRCFNFVYTKRIGNVNSNGPRPILVKFTSIKYRNHVRQSAYRLKGTKYSVREHYPLWLEIKRRKLYPIRKWAKSRGRNVKLYRDKLYIDEILFVPGKTHFDLLGYEFMTNVLEESELMDEVPEIITLEDYQRMGARPKT